MNSNNKKRIQVLIVILIAVITLGIGYASISAINLFINGNATATVNDSNFIVKFLDEDGNRPSIDGSPTNTISVDTDTTASFNVSTLIGKDDSVTATLKVKNASFGIGAVIGLDLTSSNQEYFKVTEKILDNSLQAGEITTVTIKVEMLKTPENDPVSTTITATLTATPMENAEASGGEEKEEIRPKPVSYTYTINGVDNIYINTDISDWARTFSNFPAAKAEFGHPGAIANIIENGLVQASFVAFERNGTVYYLKGRIDESSLQAEEREVYNANVEELKKAFPNWSSGECTDYTGNFRCSADGFHAYTNANGNVYAGGSDWGCNINNAGSANCGG